MSIFIDIFNIFILHYLVTFIIIIIIIIIYLFIKTDEAGCSSCDYSSMECVKYNDVYKCICKSGFASLNGRDCQSSA